MNWETQSNHFELSAIILFIIGAIMVVLFYTFKIKSLIFVLFAIVFCAVGILLYSIGQKSK